MKKIFLTYLICFCCTYLAEPAAATEGKPLQLTDLIKEALARNPQIKAMEKETQAYSFRIKPSQTLPDPMIEFSLKNMGLHEWMLGKDPNSGIGVSYSQVFPFFGKLKLAGDIAGKTYEARQHALETTKLEIARDIKTAYFDLFYLQKALEILEKQKVLMQKILALTETQYSVGSGSQNDIFKAQLEISRMDEMIIPMREMIKMKQAIINLLLDYPAARPLGKPQAIACETIPFTLPQLEEILLKQSPRLKEIYSMQEEKSLMVQVMRKEFKPDFRITAGWEYKGKLPDMYEIMLGMEIPLFANRKQQNRLQEARNMAESAQFDSTAMKNNMLTELNDYYLRAKTSENLVHLYKTRILPQARLALEASFAAYPVNKTDFMALLSDISAQFSAELAYYRELSQMWGSLAVIETLIGGALFEKIAPPPPPTKAFDQLMGKE
jgi:outer membrane protein TolC